MPLPTLIHWRHRNKEAFTQAITHHILKLVSVCRSVSLHGFNDGKTELWRLHRFSDRRLLASVHSISLEFCLKTIQSGLEVLWLAIHHVWTVVPFHATQTNADWSTKSIIGTIEQFCFCKKNIFMLVISVILRIVRYLNSYPAQRSFSIAKVTEGNTYTAFSNRKVPFGTSQPFQS